MIRNVGLCVYALTLCIIAGCATTFDSSRPYINERRVGDWKPDWFGDGAPTVLSIYNPLTRPARIGIECPNNDPPDYPQDYYEALVEARSVKYVLIEKLNRNQLDQVCHVTGWVELY